jgi:Fe-S-cluster containining protein
MTPPRLRCRRCGDCCKANSGELLGGSVAAHALLAGPEIDGKVHCKHLKVGRTGLYRCGIEPIKPWYCKLYPDDEYASVHEGCGMREAERPV